MQGREETSRNSPAVAVGGIGNPTCALSIEFAFESAFDFGIDVDLEVGFELGFDCGFDFTDAPSFAPLVHAKGGGLDATPLTSHLLRAPLLLPSHHRIKK
jgi:hypothetical protein